MIKGIDTILLSSGNAKQLADFYKEKVGLEIAGEFDMGDKGEKLIQMKFSTGSGWAIMDHTEVKGANKEPSRYILNLEVDNIEEEVKKLDAAGIKKIQDIYHIEEYGQVATFEDIDGNYFQLVQVRPNS